MRFLPTLAAFLMTTASVFSAEGPVRHVVSFKFKAAASAADIARIEKEFTALQSKIAEIKGFEWGKNISPEDRAKGFTHMWVLTFDSMATLKTYIDHPDHVAFVQMLKPSLEDVFVFDFTPSH